VTSIHTHKVRIYPNGTVDFPHLDFDNAQPITVWFENGEHIVFKIPGGRHWKSILETSVSHPGQYMVTRIEEEEEPPSSPVLRPDVRYLRVRELFSMPLRRTQQP
jgi:hypothetical protein